MSRAAVVLAFGVLVAACSSGAAPTTTLVPTASTTTTVTIPARVETTTTLDPGAADAATIDRVNAAIDELIVEAETIRGLVFIERPAVVVLEPGAYADRLGDHFDAAMATAAPAGKTGFYRLSRLLPFGSVESVLGRLEPPPTPVFYDPAAYRLVVSGDADASDPVARAMAIHEVILALADHHHRTGPTRAALLAEGADDRLTAFDALVEGDATYFQLLYVQSLTPEAQAEVAEAFRQTDTALVRGIPDFVRADLAFPYDAGVTFVSELVAAAGIAGVDQAYRDPPQSSEHILHPERYRRGDRPLTVSPVDITVAGATVTPSATFGELQLAHLLSTSMQAGMVTQSVDGWQGDQYQIVEAGEEVAFGLSLLMASDDDAIEVVGGLIAHAREVLDAGDGAEAAGGLVWDSEDGPFVFIDRVGEGLIYVLATNRGLGREVRSQMRAP